MRRFQII